MSCSSEEIAKEISRGIAKAMGAPYTANNPNTNFVSTGNFSSGGCTVTVGTTSNGAIYGYGTIAGHPVTAKDFIPNKIIYNCPATICYFPDGSKIVVKCGEDEEYIKEVGVMACITKKIFDSRNSFKKLIESGYENEEAKQAHFNHNINVPFQRHPEE